MTENSLDAFLQKQHGLFINGAWTNGTMAEQDAPSKSPAARGAHQTRRRRSATTGSAKPVGRGKFADFTPPAAEPRRSRPHRCILRAVISRRRFLKLGLLAGQDVREFFGS